MPKFASISTASFQPLPEGKFEEDRTTTFVEKPEPYSLTRQCPTRLPLFVVVLSSLFLSSPLLFLWASSAYHAVEAIFGGQN